MPDIIELQECMENICEVELFSGLDTDRLMMIARLCELKSMSQGGYMIKEGQTAKYIYILLDGEITISKTLKLPKLERVETEERILSKVTSEGMPILGETALLSNAPRQVSIQCATDIRYYRIKAEELAILMASDPDIAAAVYKCVCEMLNDRLDASNKNVVKLTAALLFALEQ